MMPPRFLLILLLAISLCEFQIYHVTSVYLESLSQQDVEDFFRQMEKEDLAFNKMSSNLTVVDAGMDPGNVFTSEFVELKQKWYQHTCGTGRAIPKSLMTKVQQRKLYLLCRGPDYTTDQLRQLSLIQSQMYEAYLTSTICLNESTCLHVEPELEHLIGENPLNFGFAKWAWIGWHDLIGSKTRELYPDFVKALNAGARNNHYHDIGDTWREELEIENLELTVFKMFEDIKPLYKLMHAVVRFLLRRAFPSEIPNPYGLIPEHLLGNLWGHDWSSLLFSVFEDRFDVPNWSEIMRGRGWSVPNMARRAEDYYMSMGFPKMSDKFWKNSRFEKESNETLTCHGTAANMFLPDDFRIVMCGEVNLHDFYVLHHEMGHIEYYMAYQNLSSLFQDGLNSAFHESIGDTIMLGVMSPIHLHRLGLINDAQLNNDKFTLSVLMGHALTKIPHIAYALTLEKYRWDIFRGLISEANYNREFWRLNARIRGVKPANRRDESTFDAGAKFHVIDNTPYIRYFLSHIIQVQMFKAMCEIELYGNALNKTPFPFQLNLCDLYGARKAGKRLKALMSYGASKQWNQVYPILTGTNKLSTEPLLEYYKPIFHWLENFIVENKVPVGW